MFDFLKCKIPPEYTLIPQADGGWGVCDNWTNVPQVIRTYQDVESAKTAVANLRREKIYL